MSAADRATDVDVARAETVLALPADAVRAFLGDAERLFRLNPQLAIERWESRARGFRLAAFNESNGRRIDTEAETGTADGALVVSYANSLKLETRVMAEAVPEGVRLVVTEHYPRIDDADDPRVADVDKSLVPWVMAIRRHLLARRRWGRLPLFPLWRWWNEGFMLSMAPRSRRIVRLLVWVTVLEFMVFLGAVVVLRLAA
ncbi:MAG: hypothetical protein KJ634_03735 [Gammaproteobacteria bacterium]|nr:hypothetical protein [Gammaproteobacteria bacterium]MBU1414715.1 hypothetical protein [Gammaproteobacteria bacterium]